MKKDTLSYYIFVFSLFLFLVAPKLFSDGMFSDGLQYATISRNMAIGLGNFWHPHLTDSLYPVFHEHPPLALFLQSVCFRIFGDSIFVERFYSLFTFILTGWFLVLLWKELTNKVETGWIPLLLWISIPKNSWACANNMLENSMMVFVVLSALFYLKSLHKKRWFFLFFSAIVLDAALFSKGFPALYVWSFPLWMALIAKKINGKRMLLDTLLLILFTVLPVLLLLLLSPAASESLSKYFNRQIVGSIENIQTVSSRFTILLDFLSAISIPLLIGGVVLWVAQKQRVSLQLLKRNRRMSITLFMLAFSGVFPIMVSLKQRSFYILTVYPFFALALALFLLPVAEKLLVKLEFKIKFHKRFALFSLLLLMASVGFALMQTKRIGRDRNQVEDVYRIIQRIGKNKDVSISPQLFTNWHLHGYFGRYGNVSLDPNKRHLHNYYISSGHCKDTLLLKKYHEIPLKTNVLRLYQRTQTGQSNE